LLLLLLPLSLGWKVAVQRGGVDEVTERDAYLTAAEFLVRQRYRVAVSEKLKDEEPIVQATVGACRILVIKARPEGSDRDQIRRQATAADTIFVVFGGRIYAEQPTWLTSFDALWAKFRREFGFKAHTTPAFVVIATKGCGAERLPWSELG